MKRPQANEYPIWAENYISKVNGDVFELLNEQKQAVKVLFEKNTDQQNYAYATGKWTLKEMLGHIIDTERILVYRLTSFARNEKQQLPGFDEDEYVNNARFATRNLNDLTAEFVALRNANFYLFKSLSEEELDRSGVASGREISVRAILFVIAGHIQHHLQILKERYHVV